MFYPLGNIPIEAISLIYMLFFKSLPGFENTYMVELKKDDPLSHILKEDENFIIYRSENENICSSKYMFDEDWVTITKESFKNIHDIQKKELEEMAKKIILNLN
jgi:hypothetical protein